MNKPTICANLNHLGLLCVAGEGAKKFLQGQLTCNLDDITPTSSSLGAHCNPQGRIISLFRLFVFRDQYYLQMPRELIPVATAALIKYAVFFKVTLQDATDTLEQIAYSGPALQDLPTHALVLSEGVFPYTVIIAEASTAFADKLNLKDPGSVFKSMDISAGIPAIYPETSEKFLPHEINLHKLQGISFNKGCYTGQEIIARMHYRGKLKNHMYLAKTDSSNTPLRNNEIFNQTGACGSIVDFIEVGYNSYELLIIAPEADVNSTPLFLDEAKTMTLDILALPYSL